MKEPTVITIKYRDGAYYVDQPNFSNEIGERVVLYDDYMELKRQHLQLRNVAEKYIDFGTDWADHD